MAKDKPSAVFYRDANHPDIDAPALIACTNAIIDVLRDYDSEIMFWGLCNALVSLMVHEPENAAFMLKVLNNSPWDQFAQKRRNEKKN